MLIVVERRETFHYYYPMGVHPPGDLTVTGEQLGTKYRILCHCGTVLETGNTPRYFDSKPMERYVFFSLAFFAVIFMEMLSDLLLVADRRTAWKALNGNVSEAKFHNLQQIVLCENQKGYIEKKLASTMRLVLMICATAAFVWFTFWYKVLL